MNKLNVIVLANGGQTRFPASASPKQLLEVDGEPIVRRTVREFARRLACQVKVVTGNPAIIDALSRAQLPVVILTPGPTPHALASLQAVRSDWGARTLCLFGDVYYTDAAIETIASCERELAFFGRRIQSKFTGKGHGEIVAVAWNRAHAAAMQRSLEYWRDRPLFWSVYRDFAGLWDIEDNYLLRETPLFIDIDDWTDDFDTPEEYARWCKRRIGVT